MDRHIAGAPHAHIDELMRNKALMQRPDFGPSQLSQEDVTASRCTMFNWRVAAARDAFANAIRAAKRAATVADKTAIMVPAWEALQAQGYAWLVSRADYRRFEDMRVAARREDRTRKWAADDDHITQRFKELYHVYCSINDTKPPRLHFPLEAEPFHRALLYEGVANGPNTTKWSENIHKLYNEYQRTQHEASPASVAHTSTLVVRL